MSLLDVSDCYWGFELTERSRELTNFYVKINGIDEVYIPKSLISKVSLHQLVSMDLIYSKKDTNCWKAIKVNNLKTYIDNTSINLFGDEFHVSDYSFGNLYLVNNFIVDKTSNSK